MIVLEMETYAQKMARLGAAKCKTKNMDASSTGGRSSIGERSSVGEKSSYTGSTSYLPRDKVQTSREKVTSFLKNISTPNRLLGRRGSVNLV